MERKNQNFCAANLANYTNEELQKYADEYDAAIASMAVTDLNAAITALELINEELNNRKS